MPSGGHARSGPAPDPSALRRDRRTDASQWIRLPAAGRAGDPPAWPLSRATAREKTLWATEWSRPQAVVWEQQGLVLEVAMYVRNVVAAEKRDATPPARTLVMRQMDSLGLTIGGLARNRWVIDDADAQPAASSEPERPPSSARERFEVIVGRGA